MNLQDKREKLEKKQKDLAKNEKSLKGLKEKVKALTIEDEDYKNLVNEVNEVVEKITTLKDDIEKINTEITEEEKNLKLLENENKMKGITKKMNYLKTKDAVKDFAQILAKGMDGQETRKAWEEHLKSKSISNPELLLPTALVTEITSYFENSQGIYSTLNDTGLTVIKTMLDTIKTNPAKGHTKGTDKTDTQITLAEREIRAQYIYEYLTVDRESIRETADTDALVTYVLNELPKRIISKIEEAVIVGDDSISKIKGIATESASDGYVTTATATANLYEDLINLKANISAQGNQYLVMAPTVLSELQLAKDGNGNYIFPAGADISSALGVEKIFTPSFMTDHISDVKAVLYVGDAYKLVGDKDIASYENFVLSQNKNEFLMEIYKGGALAEVKGGAVLTVTGA